MNSFRRAFGIDAGRERVTPRKKELGGYCHESSRIAEVRRKVQAQGEALGVWWKVALQTNLQQRMWMKLGELPPSESFLPSKYERLYQPDKIAQFDRFFARGWATPLRRSHSAQHTEQLDVEGNTLTRALNHDTRRSEPKQEDPAQPKLSDVKTLPANPTISLSSLVHRRACTSIRNEFLGEFELSDNTAVPEEYKRYCSSSQAVDASAAHRRKAVAEFQLRLHDCSIHVDDVVSIRRVSQCLESCARNFRLSPNYLFKLAESAHINRTIRTGPYRGLKNDDSAVEVETAIHEQFIGVERSSSSSKKLVEMELKRRGLDTHGVKETVEGSWAKFCASEKQFTEVVNGPLPSCGRSDLTTPETYQLYTSLFDDSSPLEVPDLIFLSGEKVEYSSPRLLEPKQSSSFAKKASRLGISVQPHEGSSAASGSSLFPLDLRKRVPRGFEQINDDLFCRKANKFFVLNGAAVDTWFGMGGTEPVTRLFQSEDVYLGEPRR